MLFGSECLALCRNKSKYVFKVMAYNADILASQVTHAACLCDYMADLLHGVTVQVLCFLEVMNS